METMSTGQAAEALGVTEPRLQELMRRRKIAKPKMVNGRRVWTKRDVEKAQEAIGRSA